MTVYNDGLVNCCTTSNCIRQEVQLPQRDRAKAMLANSSYVSLDWELDRFQTAKVTLKVIQGH